MLRATIDQETIREWADDHGLLPATFDDMSDGPDEVGELTFITPGEGHGATRPVDWSEFFEKFEDKQLALLFDDDTPDFDPGTDTFKFTSRLRIKNGIAELSE